MRAGEASCAAGTARPESTGGKCVVCAAGTYAPKGGKKPCSQLKCGVGFTDHDAKPATPCVLCIRGKGYADTEGTAGKCKPVRACAEGQEATNVLPGKDVQCTACGAGKYRTKTMPQWSAKDGLGCVAHAAACPGSEIQTPTATRNRLCSPCKPGQQFYNVGSGECSQIRACKADEEVQVTHTLTSDRTCRRCGTTEYMEKDLAACKPLQQCSSDEYESTAPTRVTNRACSSATKCAPKQWEVKAAVGGSANRVCADCTVCPGDHTLTQACGRVIIYYIYTVAPPFINGAQIWI